MSMTRKEMIERLEQLKRNCHDLAKCSPNGKSWALKEMSLSMALTALRPVSREQLSEFQTCELVDELQKREGVETHIAEPYQDMTVSVNGPAVVLVVID